MFKRSAEVPSKEEPRNVKRSKMFEPALALREDIMHDMEKFMEKTYCKKNGELQKENDQLYALIQTAIKMLVDEEREIQPGGVYKLWRNTAKTRLWKFYRAKMFYSDVHSDAGANIVLNDEEDEFHKLFTEIKVTRLKNFMVLKKKNYKNLTLDGLNTVIAFYGELESSMTRIIREAFDEQMVE